MKKIIFVLLFCAFSGFSTSTHSSNKALIHSELISPDIPTFDCHTSNIIELSNGNFLAVWKGGPGEGLSNIDLKKNIGIWLAKKEGNTWSDPVQIVSSEETVCWNPVLAKMEDDELILFYRKGYTPRRSASFIKRSFDNGKSWSKEEILPAGIHGPTLTHPLITKEGKIIAGSSISVGETSQKSDQLQATACWVEVSSDKGKTWEKYGPILIPERHFGPIEPALFLTKEGYLAMLCRDRANKVGKKGYIWKAISKDQGKHWSFFEKTNLPNPDSGVDVVDFGSGNLLLVYNHSPYHRYPLSVAISKDSGKHWKKILDLETTSGEFPSAVLGSDGMIHITYAIKEPNKTQRRIKYIQLDPSLLF